MPNMLHGILAIHKDVLCMPLYMYIERKMEGKKLLPGVHERLVVGPLQIKKFLPAHVS